MGICQIFERQSTAQAVDLIFPLLALVSLLIRFFNVLARSAYFVGPPQVSERHVLGSIFKLGEGLQKWTPFKDSRDKVQLGLSTSTFQCLL